MGDSFRRIAVSPRLRVVPIFPMPYALCLEPLRKNPQQYMRTAGGHDEQSDPLCYSHLVDLVGVGIDDVHGASNTRIEAVHCPQDFQWPLRIGNGSTD